MMQEAVLDRIGPFGWNKCYYMDCLDGLRDLPDKSIDLCLTDPPYNIINNSINFYNGKIRSKKVNYEDNKSENEYQDFSLEWYRECRRTSNCIVFTPGYRNRQFWFNIDNFDLLYWVNMYRSGSSRLGYNKVELFFIDGKINHKFPTNVIKHDSGFNGIFDVIVIHPHPKPFIVYQHIIKNLKPESVLDPFLGSGTTAQAAESLGIPWLGFEIMKEYKPDIDKRIALGKKEFRKPKQRSLF